MTQTPSDTPALDPLDTLATKGSARAGGPSLALCLLICLAANGLVVGTLWLFGRPFVPPHEPLRLWSTSFELVSNSQHLADPYSLMHLLFGAGLFVFVDWLKPFWPARSKLVVVVLGSAAWEIVENTPPVIALFNETSQPGAYAGDSIVNSLSDTAFVVIGFFLARLLGWRLTLLAAAVIEIVLLWSINDGLLLGTLRVLRLV
ncbi:DUF2585 family protein [Aurantimonas aggregata]|uniref:DUF2585 family protein n=1 Tax=Aurantimonas aggregata TaxID=2047720 RepID=A0A6L9MEK8_9HYPH|nr:DUF2585 family protein [Aurantimonas aggregata]NDV86279.1 DUF2585 family protein [Aurantimonas aggregata]